MQESRPDERNGTEGDGGARRGSDGLIADLAKKAIATSVSALLSTEEGLRTLVGTVVPKEVGRYVARELSQLRGDFVKAVVGELSRFLDRIEPAAEIQKVLSGLTFDMHVTIGISKRKDPAEAARPPAPPPASRAPRRTDPAKKALPRRKN